MYHMIDNDKEFGKNKPEKKRQKSWSGINSN